MYLQERLFLLGNMKNVLDIKNNELAKIIVENDVNKKIVSILNLRGRNLNHDVYKIVYNWLKRNIDNREIISIKYDLYNLPVTYNKYSNLPIINLSPLNVDEISYLSVYNIYALSLYAFFFEMIINNPKILKNEYVIPIIKYLLSFYVQVFGKKYGLVSVYSDVIPLLYFLIGVYVFRSFLGFPQEKAYKESYKLSFINYNDIKHQLDKYNFINIKDFILALNDFNIFKGITVTIFISIIYKYFGKNILAMIEDYTRFMCSFAVSSVNNNTIVSRYLQKYNIQEYKNIINNINRIIMKYGR